MPFLEVSHLTRAFAGVLAVDDMSFHVDEHETVSVIGPNGAGKTTLFNLITGLDQPTAGQIVLDGVSLADRHADEFAKLGIARTFQHGRVFGNLSVLDNVLIGAHSRRSAARPRSLLGGVLHELWSGLVNPPRVRSEERQLRAEAEEILALYGDRLLPRLRQPAYGLSYANRRRVEIARALMARPRLLLLDEPTAGMNPTETAEMLDFIAVLRRRGLTILLIEHKLSLVMQLSDHVVVMDDGRKLIEGAPETVRHDPQVIEAYLGHKHLGHADASEPSFDVRSYAPRLAVDPAAGIL